MQAAVFLDRDNTLIHNDGDLGDPAQVRLIQGAAVAIGSLRGLGYKIVVVSNQGGVARGKYEESDVDAVHERINALVRSTASGSSIDRFYYCPYHPEGTVAKYTREHTWRKPQPGMLLQAAKDLNLDLSQSWMIGDQMRDVAAGMAAGARTILLRRPGSSENDAAGSGSGGGGSSGGGPSFVAGSLIEAVRIVAKQRKPEAAQEIHADAAAASQWSAAAAVEARRRREQAEQAEQTRDSKQASATGSSAASAGSAAKDSSAAPKRPFRPWNAPDSSDATDDGEPTKPAAAKVMVPRHAVPISGKANAGAASSPTPAAPPTTLDEPAGETPAPPTVEPETSTGASDESANLTHERDEPEPDHLSGSDESSATDREPVSNQSMHVTLRQILQELRNQRSNIQEFSILGYLAIVLQLVAAICLIGGFLMSPHHHDEFLRWLGVGIFIQLAVIAVLLFDRE